MFLPRKDIPKSWPARQEGRPARSVEEFGVAAENFRAALGRLKSKTAPPPGGWYPFESLTAIPWIVELLAPVWNEIFGAGKKDPVADLGCGDGDFAMLFASLGIEVDAVDLARNNLNKMKGIQVIGNLLNLPVRIHEIDLDAHADLPSERYSLALFLGTLYHLKNPYSFLEKLACHTRWCVLSTRIAQVTPRIGALVEDEPVAYLADGLEIEGDATNYWIFSAAGLLRIAQRTRWAIRGVKRVGCLVGSNPIVPGLDERMILLLQSRVFLPNFR